MELCKNDWDNYNNKINLEKKHIQTSHLPSTSLSSSSLPLQFSNHTCSKFVLKKFLRLLLKYGREVGIEMKFIFFILSIHYEKKNYVYLKKCGFFYYYYLHFLRLVEKTNQVFLILN
jgi:hypothetical protein